MLFSYPTSSEKGSTSKEKSLVSLGPNSFLLKSTLFLKGFDVETKTLNMEITRKTTITKQIPSKTRV